MRSFFKAYMINLHIINSKWLLAVSFFLFSFVRVASQPAAKQNKEIDVVSDTQQPLAIEKIKLKSNHNVKATSMIFSEILKNEPAALYMLGDIVGLGSSDRKWRAVDKFIDSCHQKKIEIHAILGNHDLMWTRRKGEKNFTKRFPADDKLNYASITDSIAMVMLNSNFKKLSFDEINKQADWYKSTLRQLDGNGAVKLIIVCCHHAPYTNSLIVGSSKQVQQYFVPNFLQTQKCKLFITGHAHAFEHFKISGKDFLTIGGGGGLHQPLNADASKIADLAADYKPMFHYLSMQRNGSKLLITSHFLTREFAGFKNGYSFEIETNE